MTLRNWRREKLRLTQDQIAKLASVSQTVISVAESGTLPSPFSILRICKAYKLSEAKFKRMVNAAKVGGLSREDQNSVRDADRIQGGGPSVAAV